MWFGLPGTIAIEAIDRSCDTAGLPGTTAQVLPPSVDLNSPTPASESLEPLGSPVPAYRVLPAASFGSTTSEPIALDVMPLPAGVHVGFAAVASSVRNTPPPAAPIHIRQPRFGLPQFGSMASAVVRPELVVGAPV